MSAETAYLTEFEYSSWDTAKRIGTQGHTRPRPNPYPGPKP